LNLNSGTFRDELTLEYSINSDAFIVAEIYGFGPGKTFLEENMLEVCADKGVLDWVAVIIKSLHHVYSPGLV